jgi:drug/metabolite transporter (DMT)-like permease
LTLHVPTGRWRLGLTLALVTAALWATLPVVLKIALEVLDPLTLTWTRFAFAAIAMLAWLAWRGELRVFAGRPRRLWLLLLVAAAMLVGNYVFYLLGLRYTTPANAQLLIQAAPLLMALGGIWVFRERFTFGQWAGLALIVAGLVAFFADQLARPAAPGERYVFGSALVGIAAIVWAVYALAQKQLLMHFSSAQVMTFIYVVAAIALLPFARPGALLQLDALHGVALLYCAVNTLGAYGAFAEALTHWEASRVSVVLALTPVLTVGTVALTHHFAPQLVRPEHIALTGWIGAALVVAGSVAVSVLRARPVR